MLKSKISLIILLCFALTGCSKPYKVGATGLLSGEQFFLPVDAEECSEIYWTDGMEFVAKKGLNLPAQLDANTGVALAGTGGGYVIVKDNGNGTADHFYISFLSKSYVLSNMSCNLQSDNGEGQFLIPLHIISDERLLGYPCPRLIEGVEYETAYGAQSFMNFYENSGWYDVELVDDSIHILSYKASPTIDDANLEFLEDDFPLKIEFTEQVGQLFFTISHAGGGEQEGGQS